MIQQLDRKNEIISSKSNSRVIDIRSSSNIFLEKYSLPILFTIFIVFFFVYFA